MLTARTAAGIALALALTPLAARGQERVTLTGDRVVLFDLAGNVSVVAGTGNSVVVEITRGGDDAARLKVESGPFHSTQALRVIFPGDRIIYRRERGGEYHSEMWVREDGTFGGGDHDGDGHRVQIRSSGDGLEAWADLRVMVPPGKRVSVNIGVGRIDASNVNGDLDLDTSSGNVSAERIRGSLNVDTGSGDVTVTTVDGDLSIDTGSGNVRFTGATSGNINVDTGSGDVTGTTVRSTDLSVDTGSGNILLGAVTAPSLRLETGSGDVEVDLLSDTDDINVETGSGNVTIGVPANFGSAIDVETSSGDVSTEMTITVTRRSEDRLIGRIGDGQGRLHVETGSGDVTLRESH
jgi:lia operon protein LiaG